MKEKIGIIGGILMWSLCISAQNGIDQKTIATIVPKPDTSAKHIHDADNAVVDSIPTVTFREVDIVRFKTAEEQMLYYKYKARIQKVMPYVKIARQLYFELKEE